MAVFIQGFSKLAFSRDSHVALVPRILTSLLANGIAELGSKHSWTFRTCAETTMISLPQACYSMIPSPSSGNVGPGGTKMEQSPSLVISTRDVGKHTWTQELEVWAQLAQELKIQCFQLPMIGVSNYGWFLLWTSCVTWVCNTMKCRVPFW